MVGHWISSDDSNVTLGFQKYVGQGGELRIAAADCYQVFLDGKFIGFGPARAAHGYAREERIRVGKGLLTVVVASYHIESFWLIKQDPFVRLRLSEGGAVYTECDFGCFVLTDRRRRVQRYSYQRVFIEDYVMEVPRREYYLGKPVFPRAELVEAGDTVILPTETSRPKYEFYAARFAEEGGVAVENGEKQPWRDRAHTHVGYELDGFPVSEWEHSATDEAARFCYLPKGEGGGRYVTYDLGRIISGFAKLRITVKGRVRLYLLFDEIASRAEDERLGVRYNRNDCSNCVCFELGEGEHELLTFEPYAMRYMKLVLFGSAQIGEVGIVDYSNPDISEFEYAIADPEAELIMGAALQSFAQNAVDLFMDCPSRERAGWLADSWFTSVSERLFTGKSTVEKCFLENYADASCDKLPRGMIPMCYPADSYDGMFIPNYAMWYILELEKYCEKTGDLSMAERSKEKVMGILGYFSRFENEFGLLENLEGWIFVEWSAANDASHVCGVNYPSNICWYACLKAVAGLYGMPELLSKAERLREAIIAFSFDGEFFVDNSVRKGGELVRTDNRTEVCQYYAFWFGVATRERFPALWEELMQHFGAARGKDYRRDVAPPNAIFGIYMRLDLMKRCGMREKLYEECKSYFYPMAVRTGTLWECNRDESSDYSVSCDHGFASYAATWLGYALCGYTGDGFDDGYLGIDCSFRLPEIKARVTVRGGVREISYENSSS